LAVGERAQLAVSAAADSGLRIFRQGELVAELQAPLQVSDIDDVNNWLGRSQWDQDPMLAATLLDFRIYGAALSAAELAALYQELLALP
jgi:hypothetical protein